MVARSTSVFDAARVMLQRMPAGAAGKLIENYLLPDQLDRCWMKAVEDSPGPSVFASFLAAVGVRWDCADDDLARLPANGPVVVVANHPFGLVEGQILGALAARVRTDFKILVNTVLGDVPALRDYAIPVDVSGGAARENRRSMRTAIEWVRRGGMLITFPAGEVSSLQLSKFHIADPAWNENITRIIELAEHLAPVLFAVGSNGPGFQMSQPDSPEPAHRPVQQIDERNRYTSSAFNRRPGSGRFAHLSGGRQCHDLAPPHSSGAGDRQIVAYPAWSGRDARR